MHPQDTTPPNPLSDEDFVALYPTTPNKELAARFGISIAQVEHRAARFGIKKPAPPCPRLSDAEFSELYPTTPNTELAEKDGTTVYRVEHRARRLELRKSPEYLAEAHRPQHLGVVRDDEWRRKQKDGFQRRGYKPTPEHRANLSKSRLRGKPPAPPKPAYAHRRLMKEVIPEEEFRQLYPVTGNWELTERYGVSLPSICRVAGKLGLRKENPYLKRSPTQRQVIYPHFDSEGRNGYWRRSVLERDGYACVACGRSRDKDGIRLEGHHIFDVSRFPAWRDCFWNGQALCHECHHLSKATTERVGRWFYTLSAMLLLAAGKYTILRIALLTK